MMDQINDSDTWLSIKPDHLWVCDKLILAKRLGYLCGPAGVPVPCKANYIVRPCVNFRMMSRGAQIIELSPEDKDKVPDGHFWCEVFTGRHLSFDFLHGKQVLAVEGFRDSDRLDRFSMWKRVSETFNLPDVLADIVCDNEWLNIEVIGDKIIEVHFRYNDDFINHTSDTIIPIWKDQFYASEAGDRIGFILK